MRLGIKCTREIRARGFEGRNSLRFGQNSTSPAAGRYSIRMERWHALSHAAGVPLGVLALVLTVVRAARYGDAALVTGCVLFGVGLLLAYGASACYHAVQAKGLKRFFRACDHACIYILIAGTYSPFALGPLAGVLGATLFATAWALATAGVAKAAFERRQGGIVSTLLYLGMGWMGIAVVIPLWETLPLASFAWLVGGGVVYTVGIVFYACRNWEAGHLVWHVFVLMGSVCHLISILLFIPELK